MNEHLVLLAQIIGGGAVAIGILHYTVKLIAAIGSRKQAQSAAAQAEHPECGLMSGQFISIMNQQSDLMRQMVALSSKLESSLSDVKGVAVDNARKLDEIGKGVAVILRQ